MKVVFTRMKPEIWQYKTALALKRKGVRTVSVSLKAFDRKMFNRAFDEIISLNLPNLKPKSIFTAFLRRPLNFIKFFYKLLTIKADAAICQGAPHYLTAFFIWLFKGRMKRIYFPYDFNFSKLKDPSRFFPAREVWGERYSFKNCDGVICKGGLGELELLPKSFGISNKSKICFPCYTIKEWFVKPNSQNKLSYKNSEVHAVYVGSVFDCSPMTLSMFDPFSSIINEKIHLHIYCVDHELDKPQRDKITKNDKKLERYLHVHKFVPPEKLPEEISKYDFGLIISGHAKIINPEAVRYDVGNKTATYLEASIPIIVKEENLCNSKLVNKNYLGIVVKKLENFRKSVKKLNYSRAVKKIEMFREDYNVESHILDLVNFIESLKRKI